MGTQNDDADTAVGDVCEPLSRPPPQARARQAPSARWPANACTARYIGTPRLLNFNPLLSPICRGREDVVVLSDRGDRIEHHLPASLGAYSSTHHFPSPSLSPLTLRQPSHVASTGLEIYAAPSPASGCEASGHSYHTPLLDFVSKHSLIKLPIHLLSSA